MRILFVTPPMTQLNTPYPATAYLTGFLRDLSQKENLGYQVYQKDPAIELIHRLFSPDGLQKIFDELLRSKTHQSLKSSGHRGENPRLERPSVQFFMDQFSRYLRTVGPVMRFLENQDPTLALRLVGSDFLPRGPRFKVLDEVAMVEWALNGVNPEAADDDSVGGFDEETMQVADPLRWAFGSLGIGDRARYLASLYLDDLADVVQQGIDPHFQLSRYGERLSASAASFNPLKAELEKSEKSLVAQILEEITVGYLEEHEPQVVGFTVPFPGNMLGALRMAETVKRHRPKTLTIAGGGYVNTELRQLKEPAFFDYFDFVTFDDGEAPLTHLMRAIVEAQGDKMQVAKANLLRTMVRDQDGEVRWHTSGGLHDIPQSKLPHPTYDGLPLGRYLSVVELLNPMHRLWSDGRWNKLTLAHGCYWRKCSFCDITLDYIGRYDEAGADRLVDRMEKLIAETGQSGFHFVDEACPPKVLGALSDRLIKRGVVASFWGNIRFEKSFSRPLVQKLAESGLVAVSGGLEVASDRLLAKMEKGVTVEQVARVAGTFAEAGILVHAYLMYGFPTQTVQETVDSLERVRQLFAAGCLHSAFWHRFSCTIHSPIGKNPEKFGITIHPPAEITFAANDVEFTDPTGVDHDALGIGLKKAVYNFMHGLGLDEDVRQWFPMKVPKPKVPKDLIAKALVEKSPQDKIVASRVSSRSHQGGSFRPSQEVEVRP